MTNPALASHRQLPGGGRRILFSTLVGPFVGTFLLLVTTGLMTGAGHSGIADIGPVLGGVFASPGILILSFILGVVPAFAAGALSVLVAGRVARPACRWLGFLLSGAIPVLVLFSPILGYLHSGSLALAFATAGAVTAAVCNLLAETFPGRRRQ